MFFPFSRDVHRHVNGKSSVEVEVGDKYPPQSPASVQRRCGELLQSLDSAS